MKKLRLLPLLLALPFLSGCHSSYSIGTYENADKYLVGSQTYEGVLETLDIDWLAGRIEFISDESINGMKLVEENTLPDGDKVHSYYHDGILQVKFMESGRRSSFDPNEKKLYLTYNPTEVKKFGIALTSGTLVAPKIVAKESVNIVMTSGTSSFEGIESPSVNVTFTSGSFTCKELKTTKASLGATSGNMNISNIDVDEINADMTSGNLTFSFARFVSSRLDMTSGNLNVTLPSDGGIVSVSKRSGSVTTSRECTIVGDIYTFGTSQSKMSINVTSGRVVLA